MVISATAICDSPSDRFRRHSSRTMTNSCRNWMRTPRGRNMPILLKTQVESAAKMPVTACRARVGGLCGFPDTAERVPAKSPKTGRCANVREHCGNAKSRKRMPAGGFRQREKPQAARRKDWRFSAPARPLLPAVRAVSGDENGAFLRLPKMEWRCYFPKAAKRQ